MAAALPLSATHSSQPAYALQFSHPLLVRCLPSGSPVRVGERSPDPRRAVLSLCLSGSLMVCHATRLCNRVIPPAPARTNATQPGGVCRWPSRPPEIGRTFSGGYGLVGSILCRIPESRRAIPVVIPAVQTPILAAPACHTVHWFCLCPQHLSARTSRLTLLHSACQTANPIKPRQTYPSHALSYTFPNHSRTSAYGFPYPPPPTRPRR